MTRLIRFAGLVFAVGGCFFADAKDLNNLVREFVNAPLADGEYRFTLNKAGWVYIAFDRQYFGAEAFLDGGKMPVIAFRGDEFSETMRRLEAGEHRVRVQGAPAKGGRIFIRSVKTYSLKTKTLTRFFTDVSAGDYGFEFHRRWLFPAFNTFVFAGEWKGGAPGSAGAFIQAELSSRGKEVEKAFAGKDAGMYLLNPAKLPAADVKLACDSALYRLATESNARDVGGIEIDCLNSGEEIVRWIARLVRHYGIEGRTEPLSACFDTNRYYTQSAEDMAAIRACSTRYCNDEKMKYVMSHLEGKACASGRVHSPWGGPKEILVTHPDYVVFVPDQPFDISKRDHAKLGDSYNDHFQVLDDPKRGLFYAFWTQATKEAAADQHIAFSKSADNGRTWTKPLLLAGSETIKVPRLVASWQQPMLSKSGRLYCLWNQQTTSRGPHVGMIFGSYSDDAGESWSPPKLVKFGHRPDQAGKDTSKPPSWCNWQRPLRLGKGGRFFVGSSIHGAPPGMKNSRTRVEFWRFENIDDDPKVEDIRISCFATDKNALDADMVDGGGERLFPPKPENRSGAAVEEAGIVKLPDGRLFALCRSSVGYPVWSVSADGGETWSKPKILRDRDGGRPFLHPRSPCPIYDWKGPEAGSGYYFALVHDLFDFHAPRASQPRATLYLIAGRFNPKAEQPIEFVRRSIFSPRIAGNSCYSSYTCVNGKGVLWYNDRKYFLLGREIGAEFFEGAECHSENK
jgi:hypothetical protein